MYIILTIEGNHVNLVSKAGTEEAMLFGSVTECEREIDNRKKWEADLFGDFKVSYQVVQIA